jgi:uncharacterized protein YbbC (DUF1343 family)
MTTRSFAALLLLGVSSISFAGQPLVRTGIEVLRARGFDILQNKRVGLVTNPTGVDATLTSTIDILYRAPGVRLVALFGPEHGVRGEFAAGDRVDSYTDPVTGIPVHSLYGKTHKPTPEMLEGIDVLVYDIQDIGCRSYTYISTMGLAMEAAGSKGIPFVVLDRPDPLGGIKTEGALVDSGFSSFVSPYPIPYVYGLTCGELARYLNGEGLTAARCSLVVVPLEGWKRGMRFQQTGLPWVPTSPHVPAADSPEYYVSTGVLGELGVISEGVGYTIPFRILAAEWIDGTAMAARMNALGLRGVLFRPITVKPFYGRLTGTKIQGVQLHFVEYDSLNLMSLQFLFLQEHHVLYPDKDPFTMAGVSRIRMFDMVAGTDAVRKEFCRRMRYDDIRELLTRDVGPFRLRAMKYLLY